MNSKKLTLNDLGFKKELIFIKNYYEYLLYYCQKNELNYDGNIALKIIEFKNDIENITTNPDKILSKEDMNLLIKIAEGRLFKELNELSLMYNRQNTHEILRAAQMKIYPVLEHHGY